MEYQLIYQIKLHTFNYLNATELIKILIIFSKFARLFSLLLGLKLR